MTCYGRVYDPVIGRMMNADPMVPDPLNGQAWKRYSYVINNPLALTDPNGYDFLSDVGHAISTFFGRTFGVLFRDVPILGSLFQIAAVGLCVLAGGGPLCAGVASAASAFVTGVTSGSLGAALKAGLIAGATSLAFYTVGGITNVLETGDPNSLFAATHTAPEFGSPAYGFNVAAHALVGCASAIAAGGQCGAAALAGGVGSAVGPFLKGADFTTGLVTRTVLGGLASVAGGGKFDNGAETAAFGYLFNGLAGKVLGGGVAAAAVGTAGLELDPLDIPVTLGARWLGGVIGSALEDRLVGATIGPNIVNSDNNSESESDATPSKGHTPDQGALKDIVQDATNGGRKPLSASDAETVLDWAEETNYPGWRAGPGDVSNPSNWDATNGQPHIHIPGAGRGSHVPVENGVMPR